MMENNMEGPQTLKTVPNNAWAGFLPQKVEIEISETLTTSMCIITLFTLLDIWKQPRCLHTDKQ